MNTSGGSLIQLEKIIAVLSPSDVPLINEVRICLLTVVLNLCKLPMSRIKNTQISSVVNFSEFKKNINNVTTIAKLNADYISFI